MAAEGSPIEASEVDILERLRAIPDFSSVEEQSPSQIEGTRKFLIKIRQPVDHENPAGQGFEQRFLLWHRSVDAPMVMYSGGYQLRDLVSDVTPVVTGNQISMEYRYYGESVPQPRDWRFLTVKQSADDYHHVVTVLKSIYKKKWVTHGRSKGGMTSLYFRSYYPDDVAATVPVVAPHQTELVGPRYREWFRSLARRFPECAARKTGFEREVLKRREMIGRRIAETATQTGDTFARIPIQLGIEVGLKDAVFGWFLFNNPATQCSGFADSSASDDAIYAGFEDYVGSHYYSDQGIAEYGSREFIYQGCAEVGHYGIDEEPLRDLLAYPGQYAFCYFRPDDSNPTFDPSAMRHVTHWLKSEGTRMFFVYGGTDGWSGQAVQYAGVEDAYKRFINDAPVTGHLINFSSLTGKDWALAVDRVTTWTGATPPAADVRALGTSEGDDADEEPWPPKRYFQRIQRTKTR